LQKKTQKNTFKGSVVTYSKCGVIFNNRSTASLLQNFPVKKNKNRLKFDMSLLPLFMKHGVYPNNTRGSNNDVPSPNSQIERLYYIVRYKSGTSTTGNGELKHAAMGILIDQ